MKEIKAFIKPHKLDEVVMALHRIESLTGLSVSTVQGFGRGRHRTAHMPNEENVLGLIAHAKIELVCVDDLVAHVVDTISQAAHTGLRGDGKIYVSPVDSAVRISTGEEGEVAV